MGYQCAPNRNFHHYTLKNSELAKNWPSGGPRLLVNTNMFILDNTNTYTYTYTAQIHIYTYTYTHIQHKYIVACQRGGVSNKPALGSGNKTRGQGSFGPSTGGPDCYATIKTKHVTAELNYISTVLSLSVES